MQKFFKIWVRRNVIHSVFCFIQRWFLFLNRELFDAHFPPFPLFKLNATPTSSLNKTNILFLKYDNYFTTNITSLNRMRSSCLISNILAHFNLRLNVYRRAKMKQYIINYQIMNLQLLYTIKNITRTNINGNEKRPIICCENMCVYDLLDGFFQLD